jgi:hypothetical protein
LEQDDVKDELLQNEEDDRIKQESEEEDGTKLDEEYEGEEELSPRSSPPLLSNSKANSKEELTSSAEEKEKIGIISSLLSVLQDKNGKEEKRARKELKKGQKVEKKQKEKAEKVAKAEVRRIRSTSTTPLFNIKRSAANEPKEKDPKEEAAWFDKKVSNRPLDFPMVDRIAKTYSI